MQQCPVANPFRVILDNAFLRPHAKKKIALSWPSIIPRWESRTIEFAFEFEFEFEFELDFELDFELKIELDVS